MKPLPARRIEVAWREFRGARALCLSLCLTLAGLALSRSAAIAAEQMLVEVDRAHILRLEAPIASVIVGNPMIADATIQDQHTLVVIGKTFGSTNLIILDEYGRELMSRILEVRLAANSVVTMQRGASRYSYVCTPECESILRVGDEKTYFDDTVGQITGKLDTASGQAGSR